MGKKPGLPKKYAKRGFKKGWQLWRAAKRKSSRSRTRGSTNTTPRTSTGVKPMQTITPNRRPPTSLGAPKRRRRQLRLLSPATMTALTDGLMYASTAIGTTAAVHMVPVIKDQRNWMKVLSQVGSGILLLNLSKDRLMKKAAVGTFIGAGISAILPFIPEGMKIFGRRKFTSSELQKLRTLSYSPSRIGKPYNLGKPVTTSEAMTATLGRTSNRRSRFG